MKGPAEGLDDGTLEAIIAPLVALEQNLVEREQRLKEELAAVHSELHRVRQILKAVHPPEPNSRPHTPRVPGLRTRPYAVSEQVVEEVRQIIVERFTPGEFSSVGIAKHFRPDAPEVSKRDHISKAFSRLRERNQIRLVQVRRGRGGGNLWAATERIGEKP
jgi:hypothetical protein